ncbi:tRNA (guanosine(46)-N7)-methyltransferase TrmB [Mycoplasma flocculare]|uniref:tRNA (guanine-N(7)-)-methyltransferase n=2 Tax=Mesomycoplasma flocculare TaxID=2128 RepID=A0A0A8E731_MESFC|nr:tRNA (guanosine(46)-N7)-methyltransferase TrmB [Mesomycoplasma flocculare]MXR39396.1 tRNA (guanosine(46)-N7)-methyltransferase TrmB [Mycoplasma sp. MF12]AJC49779.1 tRNA (guanine-N7)-methyltransferase [Mesomycoplasma flocculare ATCC 27399]ENX50770.1 tRNA (guanine-N(7)-)-methyltransferase [Mesomycoplasma flocculare ATCC 27716]MXR12180.1 tRNA (guanosine(46)-N7)-methyltransferase TrmB [Mesomycoplasma flocculare]MXR55901.1 tRNA (guanosine(46)-N7)-methyltransferase TrmB [Mesomycoplasma flocculare
MRLRRIPDALERIQSQNLLVKPPLTIDDSWIIEIGMGKGKMITKLAFANSHNNFLGVEKFPSAAVKSLKYVKYYNLTNFFILISDAKDLLSSIRGKTNQIWLTFPDPWPKKKHQKRRLTYKSFLSIYANLLNKNGVLKLKTDSFKFFEFSVASLLENGWKIIFRTNDLLNSSVGDQNVMTTYEEKWVNLNYKIHYLEAIFN